MGEFKDSQVLEFSMEGRFQGFIVEDGYKLKHLRLDTSEGEYCVKLSKEALASCGQALIPGDWIRVSGKKKQSLETGSIKLKAYLIKVFTPKSCLGEEGKRGSDVLDESLLQTAVRTPTDSETVSMQVAPKSKPSILVCQRLDCMNRGGRAVSQALKSALSSRHLEDQVSVKETGCMKRCKAGPNIIMPDRTRYSGIRPGEIPELIEKHFFFEANKERSTSESLLCS